MKNRMRRSIAAALALVMVLGVVAITPFTASSAGAALPNGVTTENTWDGSSVSSQLEGAGTEASPYLLSSEADFAYFYSIAATADETQHFRLTRDVYFNDENYKGASGAANSIGDSCPNFAGTLDGAGHTIYNVYYSVGAPVKDFALFHTLSGTIRNVTFAGLSINNGNGTYVDNNYRCAGLAIDLAGTLENVDITGGTVSAYRNAAMIALSASSTARIANCTINGTLNAKYGGCVGMIDGINAAAFVTIENCETNITYNNRNAGGAGNHTAAGLVGTMGGSSLTIRNCVSSGTLNDSTVNMAGYVYSVSSGATVLFENCENNLMVRSRDLAGAFVNTNASSVTFKNCANRADITSGSTSTAAGFIATSTAEATFENCVNEGNITAGKSAGGFIASATANATFNNCENRGNITGSAGGCGAGGFIGEAPKTGNFTFNNCVNSGDVQLTNAGASNAGGAAGFVGVMPNNNNAGFANIYIYNSIQSGHITASGANQSQKSGAGGVLGYVYTSWTNANPGVQIEVHGSLLLGSVAGGYGSGGLIGYQAVGAGGSASSSRFLNVTVTDTVMGTAITKHTATGNYDIATGTSTGCIGEGVLMGYTNKNSGGVSNKFTITNCYLIEATDTLPLLGGNGTCGATLTTTSLTNYKDAYLLDGTARGLLNGYAETAGEAPWLQGAETPVLLTSLSASGATMSLGGTMALNMKLLPADLQGITGVTGVAFVDMRGTGVEAPLIDGYYTAAYRVLASDMMKPLRLRLAVTVGGRQYTSLAVIEYAPMNYAMNIYQKYQDSDDTIKDVTWKMMYYGAAAEYNRYGTTTIYDTLTEQNIGAPVYADGYGDHLAPGAVTDADADAINGIATVGAILTGSIEPFFQMKNTAYDTLTVENMGTYYADADHRITITGINAAMIRNKLKLSFSGEGVEDVTAHFSVGYFLESRLNAEGVTEAQILLARSTILYMMSARAYALGYEPPVTEETTPPVNPDAGTEETPGTGTTDPDTGTEETPGTGTTDPDTGTEETPGTGTTDPDTGTEEGGTTTPVVKPVYNYANWSTASDALALTDEEKALYGAVDKTNALPRLTANGTKLVDANGKTVQLIGVNLGGWLVFEEWFCPLYDNTNEEPKAAGTEIYETLESRFTEEQVATLIKTYQENWITEYDLDYLMSIGVNCVRVPFWYRNLQDKNGEWLLNSANAIDFDRLDWIVEQCGKRGIYVILDLHGAPGFQNEAHHSGANNSMALYDDTSAGEGYRQATVALWRAVAAHFSGCGTVAGYDLLNEPYCDAATVEAKKINAVYDRLYCAVRAVDADTVNIMEGIWRLNVLPNPTEMAWTNVMYELHLYDYTQSGINANKSHISTYSAQYNVPVYVGEFESGDYEVYAIEQYASVGASFTTWTYKGVSTATQWFLRYTTSDTRPDANIVTSSYNTILSNWGKKIRTDYEYDSWIGSDIAVYGTNTTIENALKAAIANMPK